MIIPVTGLLRQKFVAILKEGLDVRMVRDNNKTVDVEVTINNGRDVLRLINAGFGLGVEKTLSRIPQNARP